MDLKSPLKSPKLFFASNKEALSEISQEVARVRDRNGKEKFKFEDFEEDFPLKEGDKRLYLKSMQDPIFQHVLSLLKEWVNDLLFRDHITITSMKDDFFDGVIFKKIVENLDENGAKIQMPLSEDVQSKERQKKNLQFILDYIGFQVLKMDEVPWDLESVFERNLLDNVQILLNLVSHYKPQGKISLLLPKVLSVNVVQIQMKNGRIESVVKPITLFK